MSDKRPIQVGKQGSYSSISLAVLILFLVFWGQGGWYRVDCALGAAAACNIINAEYVEEARP